ncbi:hypothetical protein TrRE_jg11454 [Triparma retinervis]|uniref:AP2/ERF domain-containing protein n=1 Tax=Triparma retinervis TaxID=2557542 RepID=A0A9W7KV61_9STRA|nr:hypothetical protein TrRE_jg11454 [Triparma retinervis]
MGGTIVRTFEVCDVEMTDAINLGAVSGSSFPIPGEAAVAFPPPPLQVSKRTDDPIAKATWGGVRSRRATPQRGKKKQKTQYSKYVGVTWNKTHKRYQSCLTHNRKQKYLGRFETSVEAAWAYDSEARRVKGVGWRMNFSSRSEMQGALREEREQRGEKTEWTKMKTTLRSGRHRLS